MYTQDFNPVSDLFRKVLGWSVVIVLLMCLIVYLQSTAVLDWMVVK